MSRFLFIPVFLLGGAVSALASVDSGLLSLVPSGAKIVAGIDVTHARNSEFGQYLLSKMQNEDAHFQEMIDQTGFDPRRDLQDIVFETGDPGATGKASSSFAILARGNFDAAKIKALATAKGAAVVSFNGVDMVVESKKQGQQTAIAFPEVGVAVMADLSTMQQIIATLASPAVMDTDLKSRINVIGNANDAWFVSMVGGSFLADHAGQAGQQAKALQGVLQSSGGVKLGAMIETTFDATTRSAQDATSLSDVIRFFASMVQMQRQNDPRAEVLASALDGMTLQTTGANLHVAVTMAEKSLEQLAQAAPGPHTHVR
jgi:hypothetical protein